MGERFRAGPLRGLQKELFCVTCKKSMPREKFREVRGGGGKRSCLDCDAKRPAVQRKRAATFRASAHGRAYMANYQKAYHRDVLRRTVLVAYGGDNPKCACCGECEEKFLELDHVDQRTPDQFDSKGRKLSGSRMYRWLRDNGFPPGFQLLCSNCNKAKGIWGVCPHVRAVVEVTA